MRTESLGDRKQIYTIGHSNVGRRRSQSQAVVANFEVARFVTTRKTFT
jgi:hypothetical protein